VLLRALLALAVVAGWVAVGDHVWRTYRAMRLTSKGNFLLAHGDALPAVQAYEAAVRLRPDLGELDYLLARAYAAAGERRRAIRALESAKRNYRDFNLNLLLATLYAEEGERERALAEYDRGLGFAPVNPELRRGKARVLARMGEEMLTRWRREGRGELLDRAAEAIAEAAALQPRDSSLALLHGQVLMLRGEVERGLEVLLGAAPRATDAPESMVWIARACLGLGFWEEALRAARLAAGMLLGSPERLTAFLDELEAVAGQVAPVPWSERLRAVRGSLPELSGGDELRPGLVPVQREGA
jgi:predicted Zn-dependent protease